MQDEIRELEGYIAVSKNRLREQIDADTLEEGQRNEIESMIHGQESELIKAKERLGLVLQDKEDADQLSAEEKQVKLANMRSRATGSAETREQYISRMMTERRRELVKQRD